MTVRPPLRDRAADARRRWCCSDRAAGASPLRRAPPSSARSVLRDGPDRWALAGGARHATDRLPRRAPPQERRHRDHRGHRCAGYAGMAARRRPPRWGRWWAVAGTSPSGPTAPSTSAIPATAIRAIDAARHHRTFSPATPDGDKFVWPRGPRRSDAGDLYVADMGDGTPPDQPDRPRRRRTVVAGTGVSGVTGDGGPATAAEIQSSWLATGPDGRLYFADARASGPSTARAPSRRSRAPDTAAPRATAGRHRRPVRRVPRGRRRRRRRRCLLADAGNHRIRRIDPAGPSRPSPAPASRASSGDGGPATAADIIGPARSPSTAMAVSSSPTLSPRRSGASTARGSSRRSPVSRAAPGSQR